MNNNIINIGIDIDGVLRDFSKAVINTIRNYYGEQFIKQDIVTDWEFKNNFTFISDTKLQDFFNKNNISWIWEHGFSDVIFSNADITNINIFNEIDILTEFQNNMLIDNNISIKYSLVTDQLQKNIPYTLKWLSNYKFNFFENIYFTKDKHLLDIDYLIDDSLINYKKWITIKPKNTFILYNQPYNQSADVNINRINNLSNLLTYIKI